MTNNGKLYGIGVGPGDPELITIKAVNAIKRSEIIFAASSSRNTYSLAVEIARPYVDIPDSNIHMLPFPMTKNQQVAETAWQANSQRIANELRNGRTAAFLTLGDPTTYSTFGYILRSMKSVMPNAAIETIPGITSFHAASARLNRILVEAEESLLITSGAFGGDRIRQAENVDRVAVVKAYKNIKDVNNALKETGFDQDSVAVSHCGRKDEAIIHNLDQLESRHPDYWTLILGSKTE
ncbi:MAG: precorrin-2 C(20)-methyltransferase [Desulfobacteraceae bacterium]|nr:MAG: precorrin-2 C(20)-methyltransferase [Desulfobacteraceae bacterium]